MAVSLMVLTITALLFALPVNFFFTYAFVDDVGWDDHNGFLTRTFLAVVALSALYTPWVRRQTGVSLTRSAIGSLLITASVILCAGAGYSALSMLSSLDPAIGAEASNVTCAAIAAILGVGALVAFAAGSRTVA